MPQTILIDTDAGDDVDDVLAIAFVLRRPELEIKAITTVSPYAAHRAALIQKLLELSGQTHIPVAAGCEWPLRALSEEERNFLQRPYVRNHCVFYPSTALPENNDAVSLMIRTVEECAGEITIVTIGPLTNLAAALCRAPEIASQIRGIALMGGEVHLPQAEHNIKWDYHASSIVLSSGVPLFMGTWSVTRRFVLLPDDCESIKNVGTPLCDFLSQCIDLWWPHKGGKPGPVMYDLAPLLWSYAPEYYATQAMNIAVETKGEFTTGMTIKRPGAPNAQVSVDMREREVKELYLQTILGA